MRTKEENFAKYHQYNGDEMTSIFDVLTTKMEVISIIVYIVFLLWIMVYAYTPSVPIWRNPE